jgi:peptidoglycan/xylan/chitin deacetylase (PgdA/CDA1 family)
VLLTLFMLVLFGGLCFNGYVAHVGAEGSGPTPDADPGGTAPAAATDGGPILRIGADGSVTTRRMPAKTIALTFDDGPDPRWTPQILDVLARYHAHATFFQIGSNVNEHPELARRVVAEGHEIGSHTFTHAELATTPAWRRSIELTLTSNAVAAATGQVPVLVRPPYSSTPSAVTGADFAALRQAAGTGYLAVLADLDTDDWRRPGVDAIVAAAQPEKGRGAVVMMHDSGGDRTQTVAALRKLIPRLQAQGYRFTTVSTALGLKPPPAASLGQRIRGDALHWTQLGSAGMSEGLTVLMAIAVILAALRLLLQLICARIHLRRVRRRAR